MDDQLRSFLANLSSENGAESKHQRPQEQMADEEVQQALAICNGDAIAALRITLIANAFLEAQVEELKTQISAGLQRKRNPARTKVSENPTRAKKSTRAAKA
jgi:hypothetical protein